MSPRRSYRMLMKRRPGHCVAVLEVMAVEVV
jgi:hypothetical protein